MSILTFEKDVLNLLNRDIPYSPRVKLSCGEYACGSIVKSINDARVYGYDSINDMISSEEGLSKARLIVEAHDIEPTVEDIQRYFVRSGGYPHNFKPSLAKAIYSKFCNSGDTCLDYSSGFGGRLLGCLCAGKDLQYIGFEPNTKACGELNILGTKAKEIIRDSSDFRIINDGSENISRYVEHESVDFAFSCPPYFKYEIYCLEETQSVVKYPTYEEWLNGYVTETIKGIHESLKTGGMFLIYIMNVTIDRVRYNLIEDWLQIAENTGFTFLWNDAVNKNLKIGGRSSILILRK